MNWNLPCFQFPQVQYSAEFDVFSSFIIDFSIGIAQDSNISFPLDIVIAVASHFSVSPIWNSAQQRIGALYLLNWLNPQMMVEKVLNYNIKVTRASYLYLLIRKLHLSIQ